MARPTGEEVNTYMSITGASQPLAFQKLEEYGGNLHDAVSAYFSEGERLVITNPASAVSPQINPMAVDRNRLHQSGLGRLLPLLSVARTMRASSLFDPNFRRNVSEACTSALTGRTPSTSHPVEATEVPLDFRASGQLSGYSELRPTFADVARPTSSHYPEFHGNAAIGEEYFPTGSSEHNQYDHDVEDEMIKAAIEASKRDVIAGHQNLPSHAANDPPYAGLSQNQLELEDDVLAHAISVSLKTADEEKAMHKQHNIDMDQELRLRGLNAISEKTADGRCKWGDISSKELDEAVMLESALFGERATPEGTSGHFAHEFIHKAPQTGGPSLQSVSPLPSPSPVLERTLRTEQDDRCLGTQMHGRGKEFNSSREAETLSSKEEKSCGEMNAKNLDDRSLGAIEASLPPEPALDDENAVYLLVKMPDGSRHGRRFLKYDKLKLLFDFIDISRLVKPGTYRLVRPYPRHTFGLDSGTLSLIEVGFTSKQEALYIEII